jgi:hypothetical protein
MLLNAWIAPSGMGRERINLIEMGHVRTTPKRPRSGGSNRSAGESTPASALSLHLFAVAGAISIIFMSPRPETSACLVKLADAWMHLLPVAKYRPCPPDGDTFEE